MTGQKSLKVLAWALYDLANTSFSLGIVSLYYPLWLIPYGGVKDRDYSLATSFASLAVLLFAPLLGRLADRYPHPKRFLALFTFTCILLTPLLGLFSPGFSLLLFALAYFSYQISLIYYDLLLSHVAAPEERAFTGGIGVGVGYLGSLLTILIGSFVVKERAPETLVLMFALIALLFLLFSLPLFLWVQEAPPPRNEHPAPPLNLKRFLLALFPGLLREDPLVLRFFLMRICYGEAVNTIILFMGVYAKEEAGFREGEIQLLMTSSILVAIGASFLWGWLCTRWGFRKTLRIVLHCLALGLSLAILSGILSSPLLVRVLLFGAGALLGSVLAGVLSCDRPWLFSLVPPSRYGEAFGIYAVSGRLAGIMGPLLYGILASRWHRESGVFALLLLTLLAYPILARIPEVRAEEK